MREAEEPAGRAREEREESEAGDELTRAPLDAGRAPRRRRVLRVPVAGGRVAALAASTLLVALALVALFVHATSDPGGALSTLLQLPTATPAPTFVPGANVIYFSDGAPWGVLTIDGKRVPGAALTGYGVAVSRGTHQLVYQARYFPSLRCVFSAPRAKSDTCPLDTSDSTVQFLLSQGLARVINLGSTGATMQPDQLSELTQLANHMLAQQALALTIPPGARYLNGQGQVVTASAPLLFHLSLALDDSDRSQPGDACHQFCPDPSFENGSAPAGGDWSMRVAITASWEITDAAGNRLTGPGYQAGQPFPETTPVLAGIRLTAGGWRISGLDGQDSDAVSNAAFSTLSNAMSGPSGSGGGYGAGLSVGPNPLDGCVLDVALNDNGNGPSPTARLLWRFGLLLTIDANARELFPQLPIATATEQALANSIVAQSQQT